VYFVILGVIVFATFLPGYLILNCLSQEQRDAFSDSWSLFPLSFALSFVFICMLQFVSFVAGVTSPSLNILLYGTVVTGLWAFSRHRTRKLRLILPEPAFQMFLIFLAYLIVLLMVTPSYETGFTGDWRLYYPNTFLYLGRAPAEAFSKGILLEYITKRTPFLSLYSAYFLSILGHRYDIFQVTCMFSNSLIFWGVLLFCNRFMGRRSAISALLLLPIAPAMLRAITVPEPKIIGTFFVLLAYHHYLLFRSGIAAAAECRQRIAGICAVAAFMCHPSMAFYVVWLYIDQLFLLVVKRVPFARLFWSATLLAGFVLIAPWVMWMGSSLGWHAVLQPSLTVSQPLTLTFWQYLYTRATMVFSTLWIPAPLFKTVWSDAAGLTNVSPAGIIDFTNRWGNLILRFYDQTFLAGMTMTGGFVLLLTGWSRRHRKKVSPAFALAFFWASMGAIACFFVHLGIVDNKGHATNLTAPLFVLALCYLAHILQGSGKSLLYIVAVLSCVELIFVRLSIVVAT